MEEKYSTEKGTKLFKQQMHVILVIIILFVFAPRLLSLVFGLCGVSALLVARRLMNDEFCTLPDKIDHGLITTTAWLLTFGFGFQNVPLIIAGLALIVIKSVIGLVGDMVYKRDWSPVEYLCLAVFVCMLYLVASGKAPIGVDLWH